MSGPATDFLTLPRSARHEPEKIKGSTFVGLAAPVANAAEAQAIVAAERERYADARHHCFAWRLSADPRDERSSDDGEPAGSAGPPILRQILGRELEGCVVVVTRWFGGVKLGVGGLIRAYGGTAAGALDAAGSVRVERSVGIELLHEYAAGGLVESLLRARGGSALESNYGPQVRQIVRVPLAAADEFVRDFVDGTSGRGRAQILGEP
ncbi:IMPACT family member YigZ [Planctomycetes bacterium Pla163]|uniref:IMPACT family member YigZ n=1 Tax=Rohdeia mirabilis TaxID=2528008 RepID=A0A518CZ37_9BACT|nr:IMPACT family member YigZ [Planctomycetes bacterium Pla163]